MIIRTIETPEKPAKADFRIIDSEIRDNNVLFVGITKTEDGVSCHGFTKRIKEIQESVTNGCDYPWKNNATQLSNYNKNDSSGCAQPAKINATPVSSFNNNNDSSGGGDSIPLPCTVKELVERYAAIDPRLKSCEIVETFFDKDSAENLEVKYCNIANDDCYPLVNQYDTKCQQSFDWIRFQFMSDIILNSKDRLPAEVDYAC
jgi:hypothetical protein